MNANSVPSPTRQASSEELADFLISLAATLQKHSMYPAGHPALKPLSSEIADVINELAAVHGSLRVKVAPDRLVVGDVTTPTGHPTLGVLARRLHGHQLLAFTVTAGLTAREISDFLSTVGVEAGLSIEPLGAAGPEKRERWPHILVEPVPYASLSLDRDETDLETDTVDAADTARFWDRVATPVGETVWDLEGAGLLDQDAAGDGKLRVEQKHAYNQLIESQLPQILAAWDGSDENSEAVRQGVSQLILSLRPDQLARLLEMATASGDETEAGEDAPQEVTEEAVQRLVDATRDVSNQRVPIWLVRLLTKIGMYAETAADAPGSEADNVLGDLVHQLADGWDMVEANPADYEEALGRLVNLTPVLEADRSWLEEPRAGRIVQMSLEYDEASGATHRAAGAMAEEGELRALLDLLDSAPQGSSAAHDLWGLVGRPETLRRLLEEEPPDLAILDRLTARIGIAAAEPMLDALMESDVRSTRRALFDRLVDMGGQVGPLAVDRLDDDRWYVRRNMLALVDHLPIWPECFTPAPYILDPEARVRREAFKLVVRVPALREEAILAALDESDQHTIAVGLAAAEESCPTSALPKVSKHVVDSRLDPGLRVSGVRALATTRSPAALQTLLRLTWVRLFLRWGHFRRRCPVMLEALRVLAAVWPNDPKAIQVLRRAARSNDPQIRAAVGAGEETE